MEELDLVNTGMTLNLEALKCNGCVHKFTGVRSNDSNTQFAPLKPVRKKSNLISVVIDV